MSELVQLTREGCPPCSIRRSQLITGFQLALFWPTQSSCHQASFYQAKDADRSAKREGGLSLISRAKSPGFGVHTALGHLG